MAPEQATGRPIDTRTDLYSRGVVLYEMLTGGVPFDAETPMALLAKHMYEAPPPPRRRNPALLPQLERMLLKALARDPNRRYQSAAEMAAEIEQLAMQIGEKLPANQIAKLYQKGLQAYTHARWHEVIEQLSIALDANGAAYITGFTFSADFPATPGAFDSSQNGGEDAFAAKLSASGAGLIYSTFLGGSGDDEGRAIAVNTLDEAVLAGFTGSSDFPTSANAYDTSFNEMRDSRCGHVYCADLFGQ